MKTPASHQPYKALISSDWNQCLAPCGPFDPILYNCPALASDLTKIFKDYTGNKISLGIANRRIGRLFPEGLSIKQMDDYLDDSFVTYQGVPALIDWCNKKNILFMINTTGFIGYFQRLFEKNMIPRIPAISANPLIRYPYAETDVSQVYDLNEIEDKAINTARAMDFYAIPEKKMVIIGDSGGDGPHFEWGNKHNAYTIASMAKQSLTTYCDEKKIKIDLLFGPTYADGEEIIEENEMRFDFMELTSVFERILKKDT